MSPNGGPYGLYSKTSYSQGYMVAWRGTLPPDAGSQYAAVGFSGNNTANWDEIMSSYGDNSSQWLSTQVGDTSPRADTPLNTWDSAMHVFRVARDSAGNTTASIDTAPVAWSSSSNTTSLPVAMELINSGTGTVTESVDWVKVRPYIAREPTAAINPVSSNASFIKTDATTKGTWKGVYGADGYNIINDTTQPTNPYPGYAVVAPSSQLSCPCWTTSTTDARALQKVNPSTPGDRTVGAWYSTTTSSFTIDIDLTDGQAHRLALYFVDWDSSVRGQTVQVLDAATGAVLDTQMLSGFAGGEYLVWDISGSVEIRVTHTAGANAVVSGLFFDPAQPIYSSPQAGSNNALICPSPDQSVAQGVSVPGAYAYGQTIAENNPFDPIHAPSSSACQPGGVAGTGNLDWGSQPITNTPPMAPWISSDKAYQTYNLCYQNCGQANYRPYNGRWVTIYTKIPDDYTSTYNPALNPNPGWWYVQYKYNTTNNQPFTDRTTWEMTILTRGPHLVQ